MSLRLSFSNLMYKITIKRPFFIKYNQYAHIHDQQLKIILNRHYVSGFTPLSVLTGFFQPSFWPEVDDVECWLTFPNLVVRNTTQISKKIGSKLRPWQYSRFFVKDGSRDVINYVNEPKQECLNPKIQGDPLWKVSYLLFE